VRWGKGGTHAHEAHGGCVEAGNAGGGEIDVTAECRDCEPLRRCADLETPVVWLSGDEGDEGGGKEGETELHDLMVMVLQYFVGFRVNDRGGFIYDLIREDREQHVSAITRKSKPRRHHWWAVCGCDPAADHPSLVTRLCYGNVGQAVFLM
jgi:hypothetical protein